MHKEDPKTVRWFVGIPVVTNPIIVLDVSLASVIIWLGATIVIALAQQFVGSGLTYASLMAAVIYAAYLAGLVIAVFFIVGLGVLRNKYAALYRIDHRGVYCETMRVTGIRGEFFHTAPFPVGPIPRTKSASRQIAWTDITGFQKVDAMRALILKGKRGTLTKIYCPDEKTYQTAITLLQEHADSV